MSNVQQFPFLVLWCFQLIPIVIGNESNETKTISIGAIFCAVRVYCPFLLCCFDCESLSVGDLLKFEQSAQDEFSSLWLGYTESLGSPELRTQIASLYKKASSENIIVHAGAEEAIFNFMNVMLDAGDQIIVHSPYYQSLGEVARSIGGISYTELGRLIQLALERFEKEKRLKTTKG